MNRKSILSGIAAAALVASTAGTASAQAAKLPAAAGILAKYGTAAGSQAILKSAAISTKGGLSMPAAGMEATFEMVQIAPNRMQMVTTIPGMGAINIGYDGTIGWSVNPMQGPRLLTGKELDQMRDEADPRMIARSPELYSALETVADTTMGGQQCFLVKLNWKSGRETFDCFSGATGLVVASKSIQQTAMGEIPVTTLYSDYKKFGDMTLATRTVLEVMGQQQVVTITSVEAGTGAGLEIKVPAEIQALAAKPKS